VKDACWYVWTLIARGKKEVSALIRNASAELIYVNPVRMRGVLPGASLHQSDNVMPSVGFVEDNIFHAS